MSSGPGALLLPLWSHRGMEGDPCRGALGIVGSDSAHHYLQLMDGSGVWRSVQPSAPLSLHLSPESRASSSDFRGAEEAGVGPFIPLVARKNSLI